MEKDTISDGTSARKRADMIRASHQRLWWMELMRGIITCTFGFLLLTARSFAPRLFMYGLGAYLVIDGVLVLYDVRRSKDVARMKALACWHHRGPHASLSWASSGFFVLLGLFLLLLPQLAISLLVVFLGSYMLIAGLFLLLRGLSLRFRFSGLPASPSPPPQAPPGLSDALARSTRRAIVFVRRTAADGLGHIAWGFEWMNGWFNVGSVENIKSKPFANPEEMGFWSTHTLDPMATIKERKYPYDEYKLFFVTQPHPKEAWKTVIWESQEPYSFVHHNCCDVTYEILCTYGCPVSLHKQSRREIATREIALAIPSRMKGSPPPWRTAGFRAWEELTLVWEMMIGHILTLWTSGIKLIAQYRRSSAPRP